MAINHKDIPDSGLHEPKGVVSAAAGTVYVADGAGSGSWQNPVPSDIPRFGWANYADYASGITPQSISSSTWTKVLNDGVGSQTNTSYLPTGVTSLWDAVNDQFDFTELPLGSEVELRLNLSVTTTAANQFVQGRLSLGIGDPYAYTVNVFNQHFKTAGTYGISVYNGLFIGNTLTKDNPGEFQIWSDANCSIVVSGYYVKVTRHS